MSEPQPSEKKSSTRPSVVRFAVLAWLCAAAALAYVSRNAIAVAESTVRGDLGLTKEQSGWLMSAFFISYAVFQIPGAWVGQRFGARPALPAFAVAWSLATAAMAAGSFFMLIVSRVAKGLSQAVSCPWAARREPLSRAGWWWPSAGAGCSRSTASRECSGPCGFGSGSAMSRKSMAR